MNLPSVISAYFEAWNHHDSSSLVACFTKDGLYHDPYVPEGIGGTNLFHYTQGVFHGIPDIRFDVLTIYTAADAIIVEWLMVGSPAINVPGVDVFTLAQDKILKVQGYYDRKTFETQQATP